MGRGQKALHTRWMFKIKNNSDGNQLFKARLVVTGYEQVPGVDFTKTFSPVARDTTICTVLATAMHLTWNCEAIDVEAGCFPQCRLERRCVCWSSRRLRNRRDRRLEQCVQTAQGSLRNRSSPSLLVEDFDEDNDRQRAQAQWCWPLAACSFSAKTNTRTALSLGWLSIMSMTESLPEQKKWLHWVGCQLCRWQNHCWNRKSDWDN